MNVLRTGAVFYPAMPAPAVVDLPYITPTLDVIDGDIRLARIIAAQLTSLAIRGHVRFFHNGEWIGDRGLMIGRHPDPSDTLDVDEERLVDLLFDGSEYARVAQPRKGSEWDEMIRKVHQGLRDEGLGRLRRERRRYRRRLVTLRQAMQAYGRGREWSEDPVLYRAGTSLAALFDIDTGIYRWPSPPEGDVFIPARLVFACQIALDSST